MEPKPSTIIGLTRDLAPFITGIDTVECLIGKDFVFHDAEVDEIHIDRKDETVTIKTWTWSDVDYSKHYIVTWKLVDCISINLSDYDINGGSPFVYELQFELDPLFPDEITVIFDGTGIEAECRHIDITVEEATPEIEKG